MTDETTSAEAEPIAFYSEVPSTLTHEVGIGGALITMVEPHLGHEYGYNRWYEDDHFYAGAMCMPWMMAGRRFVATRDLQLLRYPEDSFIAQPVTAGCYIHLYWITVGHVADHEAWTRSTNLQLTAQRRRFEERTHVFTAFQDFAGVTYRDPQGPRDIHSLDYPYEGIVLEVIDPHEGIQRDDLDAWLRDDYLPWLQGPGDAAVAQSLRFTARHLGVGRGSDDSSTGNGPAAAQVMAAHRGFAIPGSERRITIIHFLDQDPRVNWDRLFAANGDRVGSSGLGRLELCAPFIPVLHGTDRYVDQLR
jgi:hypothetical protein